MAPPPPAALLPPLLLLASFAAAAAAASVSSGPHIADVNVLLPPRLTYPVEYRLLGSDGCFVWSWDHHDILSVQPEFNGSTRCSTSARLISTAPYTSRKETAVYARDLQSGTTVRCKVIIDTISRIQIFHHTNKIDLDDLATLRIRAFDDEENEFSSLVGLQFLWQLVPKSIEAANIHHVFHVPLKETPLSDCGGFCGDLHTQIQLEDRGVASDLYVVKGIGIGHEVVSAQLLEPHLEHLMDKIVLTVAEAMSLYPRSPVFVTVGALIYFRLSTIRQNNLQVIGLPSQHHRWSVMNSSVADVDSMMGIAHALNLGTTNIIVEDIRLSGHVQTSSMHVVLPNKLCLFLVPLNLESDPLEGSEPIPTSVSWYVFPGQSYAILMKVYSEASDIDELYITENNDLKLESDTHQYWDILFLPDDVVTTYGWQNSRSLKPISTGQGSICASLTYQRGSSEIAEVLRVEQQVVVCSKVKFIIMEGDDYPTQIIRLPWAHGVYQVVELKATGGCGKTAKDYSWFSSDITTVSVSASGIAQARRPGRSIIKVVSVFDSINYDEVIVEVLVPSSMVMLPSFPVEAVVGAQLQAAVALKTSSGDYFHRCDVFGTLIKWQVFSESDSFEVLNSTGEMLGSDIGFIEGSKLLHGHYCAWTYLYASHAGRAVLHATFSSELQSFDSSIGPTVLKATSVLAAYSSLVVHQAENGNQFGGYWVNLEKLKAGTQESSYTGLDELYLVPGSEMDVLLLGGPEKWNDKVEYVENVQVLGEQDVPIPDGVRVQSSSIDARLYKVFCQTLGKFKLLFSRGNLVGDDHPMSHVEKAELSIICGFPSSITLIANEPENTLDIIEAATRADRGPGRIRSSPVIVANGCVIRVAAVGIHETQRPFANSSSLCLMWELDGCEELANWNDSDIYEGSEGTMWERFLFLHNASGHCTIRATVIGISETTASDLEEEAFLQLQSAENILTDAIPLKLISSLQIIPEFIVLVYSPKAKANLSITGGTCFLDVGLNDTQVAQISQPPRSAQCSHLFLDARGLGVALVTVRDVGLSPPATATALVKVANVDWIKIISQEEISLMEGAVMSFDLVAGTRDGYVFDSSQYAYMDIRVHLEDNILELAIKNDSSSGGGWVVHGPSFSVKGVALGVTNLYVSVRQRAGHEVYSQLVKVEVYKPLQVHPEYVYLTPGASYALTVKGGPQLGVFVEYSSLDSETAIVQRSSGKISAVSVGNATVRASAFGTGGMLICEAYGRVEVRIPSAMILNLQSDRLCVGCKMPIFPSFSEGNLFSFYEICKDYTWSIKDEEVLGFQSALPMQSDTRGVQFPCTSGKHKGCYTHDQDNGFMNVLLGRSAGRTKVSVSLSCDFASPGTSQPVSYITSELVTVVSDPPLALGIPITWILPPFYTTSDLLPGSSDSYGQLESLDNKRASYSMLKGSGRNDHSKQEAITVIGRKIRTKESNDLACIQVKDHTTGRSEIASCIRVSEVAQVRVTTLESSFHVAYLAVHAKLEVFISYCDDLGYPFTEADGVIPLEVETNYPDIVSILIPKTDDGNRIGNVFIQANNQGKALVRISMKHNPKKTDYILVSVGAQLHPLNPVLHVGHFLNFTVVGDGMDGVGSGKWVSGNKSVFSVNKNSGEVYALGEGAAQVIFDGSNYKLHTTVTVLKVDQIGVVAPAETLTNVPFQSQGYRFPVRFSDPLGLSLKAPGNSIQDPYDCRVDPPYIGYAKPWSDHITGNSYCLFFPHSPKHLVTSMSKSKAMTSEEISSSEGFLHVFIIASLREAPHVMGSAQALFVGGFAMEETGMIKLMSNSNKSKITLTGNTDVEIHWNNKDLLSISLHSKDGFGLGKHMVYEVKALKLQNFTDKVVIVLPATGQIAEIEVSYEVEENTPPPPSRTSGVTWTAVFICAAGLILTVVVFMKLLDRPDRAAPSRQEVTTALNVVGPVTPNRMPTVGAPSTPRTPQPFIDYVRRTVDETPYYKRNGRRFDPQRTY